MKRQTNEKARILIVDDEPSARDTLEALLFPESYGLAFAASGQEALARLDELDPDTILLDVMMPGMDGFQVCELLKSSERWRHVPVILVTALDSKEDLVRGLDAGADEFLSKPVNGPELGARVRSVLRIKSQYDLLKAQQRELEAALHVREKLAQVTAQRLEELEALHRAGLRMMNSLDADYVVARVSQSALEVIPQAAHCVMHFLSDDETGLVPVVSYAQDGSKVAPQALGTEEVIWQAIHGKDIVYVPDVLARPGCSPPYELRALLVAPMLVDERAIGTLSVDSPEADVFEIAQRRLLSILASQAAVVIMKIRLFEELKRISGRGIGTARLAETR